MKIKAEHYAQLKTEIECLPRDKVMAHWITLKNDPRVKDIDKRFRWDLLWATNQSKWVTEVLYSYMDDTHLDTALKSVVRELQL